jgi:hypothetical protein
MQKQISLSLAVALTLTGCSVFKKSQTWEKVTKAKPDVRAEADPSKAYASQLHRELAKDNVEHKVVTYQYRYRTRLREEAVGVRTAVVYKDNTNPNNPWWIMDERLGKPVWLPNDQLDKQVAFYLRRNAEIVEQHDFTSPGSGDEIRTAPAAAPAQSVAIARATRARQSPNAPVTVIARAKAQPVKSQSVAAPEPLSAVVAIEPLPAPPQDRVPWIRPARFAPSGPSASASGIEPSAAPADASELFREKHGTTYDPASHLDREKMQLLRHEARLHSWSHEPRTF